MERERRRRAAERTAAAQREAAEDLPSFIERISPRYMRPNHLGRLMEVIERTERQPVRAIVNVPPRHSKTETILHGLARRTKRRPWQTCAYVTYVDQVANAKSVLCRQYAERAGVELRADSNRLDAWTTTANGGCLFRSIGGSITALGADVLVVDDPHKDRAEAESLVHREKVWNWYIGTGIDRLEVGGSVIVCQTRWHPDDLTGRLIEKDGIYDPVSNPDGWEVIELPALGINHPDGRREACDFGDDGASPLWPERWTLEELRKKKVDDYEWWSKFQQKPRKKGGAVFKDVHWYDPKELPADLDISIGTDLAYSESTHACWSVVVVLGKHWATGRVFVLYVQREQMEVPTFATIIGGQCLLYPGTPVIWHTSTTEAGTAQLLRQLGIPVKNVLARADKFVRAQPAAAAWNNAPFILLPGGFDERGQRIESPAWVAPYVKELTSFTGVGDVEDDQVDATGSAYSKWAKAFSGRIDYGDGEFASG